MCVRAFLRARGFHSSTSIANVTKQGVRACFWLVCYSIAHSHARHSLIGSWMCSVDGVESVQKSGKICVLDIDVQGVKKVKESSLNPVYYIFIAPPSRAELEKRLRGRATEAEDAIATRLANAAAELDYGQTTGNFDRVFVNADLQECFKSMAEQFKEWYPHLVEVAPEDDDDDVDDADKKSCTCQIS